MGGRVFSLRLIIILCRVFFFFFFSRWSRACFGGRLRDLEYFGVPVRLAVAVMAVMAAVVVVVVVWMVLVRSCCLQAACRRRDPHEDAVFSVMVTFT